MHLGKVGCTNLLASGSSFTDFIVLEKIMCIQFHPDEIQIARFSNATKLLHKSCWELVDFYLSYSLSNLKVSHLPWFSNATKLLTSLDRSEISRIGRVWQATHHFTAAFSLRVEKIRHGCGLASCAPCRKYFGLGWKELLLQCLLHVSEKKKEASMTGHHIITCSM